MKKEELMIGDWVSVSGTYMQVAALGRTKAGFLDEKGEMFFHEYENIHPIPLTADLLDKNGFYATMEDERIYEYHYGNNYVVHVQKDGDFINLTYEMGSPDGVETDLVAMIIATYGDKLSVHNLQHFLTENYIDKPIVI